MEVSTKLFNAQATKNFSKINEQIQDTQAKIASGKSFLFLAFAINDFATGDL